MKVPQSSTDNTCIPLEPQYIVSTASSLYDPLFRSFPQPAFTLISSLLLFHLPSLFTRLVTHLQEYFNNWKGLLNEFHLGSGIGSGPSCSGSWFVSGSYHGRGINSLLDLEGNLSGALSKGGGGLLLDMSVEAEMESNTNQKQMQHYNISLQNIFLFYLFINMSNCLEIKCLHYKQIFFTTSCASK